jgi:maltooligosyltrehalose synthase
MVNALKEAGLGLILDIVPNHMAASLENRWWRDVIEHGPQSRYAHHFDIDWTRPLTLPFLGDTFENVLARDEIRAAGPGNRTSRLCLLRQFLPIDAGKLAGRPRRDIEPDG